MKYRICFSIISCLLLFSCSMEKKLYSSGYHVEWFHSKKDTQEFYEPEEIHSLPLISASENSSIILPEETRSVLPIHENVLEEDTIVPSNPAKTDEEYVTPNFVTGGTPEAYDLENNFLNEKEKAELERRTKYLIISAILTIFPLYFLYMPLLFINLLVIKKIRMLAKRSPYESYYLNKIKQYWRIMRWPLYVLGIALLLILFFLAVYGL